MTKTPPAQEVEVLRFFETGSLEKVEAVFNIVCEKLRERRGEVAGSRDGKGVRIRAVSRKRSSSPNTENVISPAPSDHGA